MFFSAVDSFYEDTDTQGANMASREQAIQEAAEVLVHWLTVDEAVAA
jgi:hypothetical protein